MNSQTITPSLARHVRERASDLCEYCQLPQGSQEATFHVDHISPRAAGGPTTLDNLALACVSCSLRKAARRDSVDPRTSLRVPLFHPRADIWSDHFRWSPSWQLVGRTPKGRATIAALRMNRPAIIEIRKQLVRLAKFPPSLRLK